MEKKFYKEYKITSWKFWQNFWEYYNVHTIAAIVVIVLIVIGVKSCVSRVDNDLTITYFGENPILTPAKLKIQIEEWATDIDGDGVVTVEVENAPFAVGEDSQTTAALLSRIDADLLAGDPFILMTDDVFVQRFLNMSASMSALQPLDDIISGLDIPEEYLRRDEVTNKVVAVDITDLPVANIVGIMSETRVYMSLKVLPENKTEDERYMKMHSQTAAVIRKLLEYK
ncbi:MAG: hypothetical protein WCX81_04405 [Monoglobales bacterium]